MFALLVALLVQPAFGESEAMQKAVGYLENNQNEDGSWGTPDEKTVDTVETLWSLISVGLGTDAANQAIPFISGLGETNADLRARKLLVLSKTTYDTAILIESILAGQRADGGWGLTEKKQSNILDTALSLKALLEAGNTDPDVFRNGVDFLIQAQQEEGAWEFSGEETQSTVQLTSLIAIILKDIEQGVGIGSAELSGALSAAQGFLESKKANGSYGTIRDTAFAYLALLKFLQPTTLSDTLAYIEENQAENGSWEDNIFTTAVALRALGAVVPPDVPDMPDLYVTEATLTFDPETPSSGETVALSATVFNGGEALAENISVAFYDGDPRLEGVQIGTPQTITSLEPGTSNTVSVNFDTTEIVGGHVIVVYADPQNTVPESNEVNNLTGKILTIGGTPDLSIAPEDIAFDPVSPQAFETVAITATIHNTGTGVAESIVVRFLDGAEKITDLILGGVGVGQTNTATLVTNFTEDGHTITIQVDPDGTTGDPNPANNSAQKLLTVQAIPVGPPDLAAQSITYSPQAPVVGEEITIENTIINQGGQDTGAFKVAILDGATPIHTFDVPSLVSGQKAVLTLQTYLAVGTHTITANADSENTVTESDETNNSESVAINVSQEITPADLTISLLEVSPAAPEAGDAVTISVKAKNQGVWPAQNVVVRIYDGTPPQGTQMNSDFTFAQLLGGQEGSIQLTTTLTAGTHTIYVIADPDNTISETDETNNTAQQAVTVTLPDRPDLTLLPVDITFSKPEPIPGETITVSATIHNNGTEPAADVEVLFTDGNPHTGGAYLIEKGTIGTIDAGSSAVATVNWQISRGTHDVYVVADPDYKIPEQDETNNVALKSIDTAPLADLTTTPEQIVLSHTNIEQGATISLTANISNIGNADAENILIRFIDNMAGVGNVLIAEKTIDAIAHGETAGADTLWQPVPGVHTLIVQIDPENAIPEISEANNVIEKPATIAGPETIVNLYKMVNGERIKTTYFKAFDIMLIEVISSLEGASVSAAVVDFAETERPAFPFPGEANLLGYSVGLSAVGAGTVVASIADPETEAIIQQVEKTFIIEETVAIRKSAVVASPSKVFAGRTEDVALTLQVLNGSNVQADFAFTVSVISPLTQTEVWTGTQMKTLEPSGIAEAVNFGTFTDDFAEVGHYSVNLSVSHDGNVVSAASRPVNSVPVIHIQVTKVAAPTVLDPTGEGNVKVRIDLTGIQE